MVLGCVGRDIWELDEVTGYDYISLYMFTKFSRTKKKLRIERKTRKKEIKIKTLEK